MCAVAGIVVRELNFFLIILGWAMGWTTGWLLSELDIPSEMQFYGVIAVTLIPAIIADRQHIFVSGANYA